MQVQLLHKRVVAIATSIEVNFSVFFKGVDVVKYKERIRREDANALSVFSVRRREIWRAGLDPSKANLRKCPEKSVAEDSPDV